MTEKCALRWCKNPQNPEIEPTWIGERFCSEKCKTEFIDCIEVLNKQLYEEWFGK